MTVYIVYYIMSSTGGVIDSVWSSKEGANERAKALNKGPNARPEVLNKGANARAEVLDRCDGPYYFEPFGDRVEEFELDKVHDA